MDEAASSSFSAPSHRHARSASPDARREHRRRRMRRHGRRAYIRSAYSLPSLATLGNAVCGFGAMYVAAFDPTNVGSDRVAIWLMNHRFMAAAYLVFIAMKRWFISQMA